MKDDELKWSFPIKPEVAAFDYLPFKSWWNTHLYQLRCKCGNIVECMTQKEEDPEYHTPVHFKCCNCNEWVLFNLPVN